ncbi:TPA: SIR2 family protein [Streptococcus agalactiae]|nr:SIR2 family protein [Streptococcus agalactiae]
MNFIEQISENNQFPIIFVGSGITQRYFENAPTWEKLLKDIWLELFDEESYYAKSFELRERFENNDFDIYTNLASLLEKEVSKAFINGNIQVDNLDLKTAYELNISPFKQLVANRFSNLKIREEKIEEIKQFSQMLSKARIIITTNYDNFIEECLKTINVSVKINVGNKGLFLKSSDYGELYKIHGTVDDASTITITKEDYEKNVTKSALINAKILSNLVESPILFLGYSLTDENIRKLLTDFAENSPFDISESAQKIGVVEYLPDSESIETVVSSLPDLSVYYSCLKTDNFTNIYRLISKINQGFLPSEIAKYENVFRKIIEVKGESKDLKTVLTSYEDLANLTEDEIRSKNIVVAFGDERYIYKFPDFKEYVRSYFLDKETIPQEIVIRFIATQPVASHLPIKKYMFAMSEYISKDSNKYTENIKKRLSKEEELSLDDFTSSIGVPLLHSKTLERQTEIVGILEADVPDNVRYNFIATHIKNFPKEELFLLVEKIIDEGIFETSRRRFLKAFDLLHY